MDALDGRASRLVSENEVSESMMVNTSVSKKDNLTQETSSPNHHRKAIGNEQIYRLVSEENDARAQEFPALTFDDLDSCVDYILSHDFQSRGEGQNDPVGYFDAIPTSTKPSHEIMHHKLGASEEEGGVLEPENEEEGGAFSPDRFSPPSSLFQEISNKVMERHQQIAPGKQCPVGDGFEKKTFYTLRCMAEDWKMPEVAQLNDRNELIYHLRQYRAISNRRRESLRTGETAPSLYIPNVGKESIKDEKKTEIKNKTGEVSKVHQLVAYYDESGWTNKPPFEDPNDEKLEEKTQKLRQLEHSVIEAEWGLISSDDELQAWRLEEWEVIGDPEAAMNGYLQANKTYVFLHNVQTKDASMEESIETSSTSLTSRTVHFWLGPQASRDAQAAAAYKATELRDHFQGKFQGKIAVRRESIAEDYGLSDEFVRLWAQPPCAVTTDNHASPTGEKCETWLRKAKQCPEDMVLFQVMDTDDAYSLREVKREPDSLSQSCCYILDAKKVLYLWVGEDASVFEKAKARFAASALRLEGKIKSDLFDGNDDVFFMDLLEGSPYYREHADTWKHRKSPLESHTSASTSPAKKNSASSNSKSTVISSLDIPYKGSGTEGGNQSSRQHKPGPPPPPPRPGCFHPRISCVPNVSLLLACKSSDDLRRF